MFYRFWLRFLLFFHLLYHLSSTSPLNLFSCHIALSSLDVMSSACISLRPSLVDTIPHFLETLALQNATIEEQFSETIDALAACERVLFGGCALSSKAFETLSELGLKLASQYGQTELSGMVLLGVSFCFASFLVSILLMINASRIQRISHLFAHVRPVPSFSHTPPLRSRLQKVVVDPR